MQIDRSTLNKIAHLARLELNERDAEQMMHDLTAVLNWVEKLNELDTEGIEPLTSMTQELNSFRQDEVQQHLDRQAALQNAPDHDGQYFRVPKVLE